MANEISERISVSVSRTDGYRASFSHSNRQDQNGSGAAQSDRLPVLITEVTYDPAQAAPRVGTAGIILLTNLDPTNFVKWGTVTAVYGQKILPGETHKLRLASTGLLYLIADTATCAVHIQVLED